jgi:hypothetical protein
VRARMIPQEHMHASPFMPLARPDYRKTFTV